MVQRQWSPAVCSTSVRATARSASVPATSCWPSLRSSVMRQVILSAICVFCAGATGFAATFDESIPSGANFDKADFRLWLPENAGPVRALAILVPGSNGDGRAQVDDPFWQEFAAAHHIGLVGVHL